jgi:hypothetical protein
MPETSEEIFPGYTAGGSTVPTPVPTAPKDPIVVETEKYGVGKPKRVELRAKIIRDED